MLVKDLLQRAVKILHRRLADYVGKEHQKGRRTCSTIIFPHSTNQIIDLLRCRCRCPLPGCRCRKQSNDRGLPGGRMLKFRFDRSIIDASFETSRPHPQPSSTYFQENCAEEFFPCHIIIIIVITTTLNIIKG